MNRKKKKSFLNQIISRLPDYVLGSIIFLAIGAPFALIGGYSLYKQIQTKTWPVVSGKVISEQTSSYISESNTGGKTIYVLKVKYEYSIEGKSYLSDNLCITGDFKTTSSVELKNMEEKFVKDTAVKVYYNPESPDTSVLILEVHSNIFWFMALGFIFSSLSILILIFGFYKKQLTT